MNWDQIDWPALERLRTAFLEGSAGARDYWQAESDLASYDYTFAQRIGWKWDYVVAELQRRRWAPPPGEVLDWGCGSGVAGRAFLDGFGLRDVSGLRFWDRSSLAVRFASSRAKERFPALPVRVGAGTEGSRQTTLLLSHVLTELDEEQTDQLLDEAARATAILWVEPGTHVASRRLSGVRERLMGPFQVVAPCTHQAACGMLAPENTQHWCHHFASPPGEVFTDGNWARFAKLAGIDLRSLPVSFLVLDKRPAAALPTAAVRVIGRPRVYKAHALVWGCSAAGLNERRLSQRTLPAEFRQIKKGKVDPLQVWKCADDELVETKSLPDAQTLQ